MRTEWTPEQISAVDPKAKLEAHMRLQEAKNKILKPLSGKLPCKAPQSTKT